MIPPPVDAHVTPLGTAANVAAREHRPMSERPSDLAWAAFSESAPWVLDEASITWGDGIDRLRAHARAEVPELTTPSKVPPGVRVVHVASRLGLALGPWWVRKRR